MSDFYKVMCIASWLRVQKIEIWLGKAAAMHEFHSLSDVSRIREVAERKCWSVNGAIYWEMQSIESVVQPPDSIELCALSEHVLVLMRSASRHRTVRVAGQEYEGAYPTDYFSLLPAGTPARLAWTSRDEVVLFGIAPEILRQVAEQTGCVDPDSLELQPIVRQQSEQIACLAHSLLYEIRANALGSYLSSELLLTSLYIHLLRHYCTLKTYPASYSGGLTPHRLRDVLGYIDANLAGDRLSVAMLARIAGLSPNYFTCQFRRSTGSSPHQYIIQRRLEAAKRLLERRELSIAQIAVECGFSSQSHFYGAFRKATGTTPKRYQQGF